MEPTREDLEQTLSDVLAVIHVNITMWAYKDEQAMFEVFERIKSMGIKENEILFDKLLTNREEYLKQ